MPLTPPQAIQLGLLVRAATDEELDSAGVVRLPAAARVAFAAHRDAVQAGKSERSRHVAAHASLMASTGLASALQARDDALAAVYATQAHRDASAAVQAAIRAGDTAARRAARATLQALENPARAAYAAAVAAAAPAFAAEHALRASNIATVTADIRTTRENLRAN